MENHRLKIEIEPYTKLGWELENLCRTTGMTPQLIIAMIISEGLPGFYYHNKLQVTEILSMVEIYPCIEAKYEVD